MNNRNIEQLTGFIEKSLTMQYLRKIYRDKGFILDELIHAIKDYMNEQTD